MPYMKYAEMHVFPAYPVFLKKIIAAAPPRRKSARFGIPAKAGMADWQIAEKRSSAPQ